MGVVVVPTGRLGIRVLVACITTVIIVIIYNRVKNRNSGGKEQGDSLA